MTPATVCADRRRSLVLSGVDWATYSRLLRVFSGRPEVRLAYDRGELEIMTPVLSSNYHQQSLSETYPHRLTAISRSSQERRRCDTGDAGVPGMGAGDAEEEITKLKCFLTLSGFFTFRFLDTFRFLRCPRSSSEGIPKPITVNWIDFYRN